MGHKFADTVFTASVKAVQTEKGSRNSYAAMEGANDFNDVLGQAEAEFISRRDSFYMASVGETGWPYVQHRGGPPGFIKILDEQRIGYADYSGNRQYISVGNLNNNDRVCLFFMDYPNRRRLKVLGRVEIISLEQQDILSQLEDGHFRAHVERGMLITIEGYDWNCPQFITPRFSEGEVSSVMQALRDENLKLQKQLIQNNNDGATVSQSGETEILGSEVIGTEIIGTGALHLRISGIKQLTPTVRAYEFRDVNNASLPVFEAGSHLRIPVRLPNGDLSDREYSISSNPAYLDRYEIAVKQDASGRGGSNAVHNNFKLGTEFKTGLPLNQFPLNLEAEYSILIAGGIGITPIKSMVHELSTKKAKFRLFYVCSNRSEIAYYHDLQQQFPEHIQFYSTNEGDVLDIKNILRSVKNTTEIYVCGPSGLLEAILQAAEELGVSKQRIHFEKFA